MYFQFWDFHSYILYRFYPVEYKEYKYVLLFLPASFKTAIKQACSAPQCSPFFFSAREGSAPPPRNSPTSPPPKKNNNKKKRNTNACTTNITYMSIQKIIISISKKIELSKFHIPKLLNITHSLIYIKFKYLQIKWDDLWIFNAILTPNSLFFVCGWGLGTYLWTSFVEIWSWNNFSSHSFPTADSSKAVVKYRHLLQNSVARLTDWLNVTLIALAGPKIAQTKKIFISSARGCEFLPRPHGVCFYLIPISKSFSRDQF